MVAVDVVIIAAVALLAVLVAGLLRSNAELTRALHHLGVDLGPDAPASAGVTTPVSLGARPTPARPDPSAIVDLAGVSPAGDAVSMAVTGVRHDTLVAFLTSGCQTCRAIWDVLRAGMPEVPGGARLVVVTRGPEAESSGTIASLAGTAVPVVMSTAVWEAYDVPYAPYVVYVSGQAGRVVGEGTAATWDAVATLVASAVADGTTSAAGAPRDAAHAPAASLDERWAKAPADAAREARIDRELAAAGILPGDPRLSPPPAPRPQA